MSLVKLQFANILLPLEVSTSEMDQFKLELINLLMTTFGSVNLFSSFTIFAVLSNNMKLHPLQLSIVDHTEPGSIPMNREVAEFVAKTFSDRICRTIGYNIYTLELAHAPINNQVDDDFLSRLSKLNLSSSSSSDSGNESFTLTIRKDASIGQIFDSIINNAKDYLPMKTIKDALKASVDKFTSPSNASVTTTNGSRISRSKSDDSLKRDKESTETDKRMLGNMTASDLLNAMSRGCSNTCNITCPKCEYVVVKNNSTSNNGSITPARKSNNVSDCLFYTPQRRLTDYETKFTVNYNSQVYNVDMVYMGMSERNKTIAFLDVLLSLNNRRLFTNATENSSYIKRHYKRNVPVLSTKSSNATITTRDPNSIAMLRRVTIPPPSTPRPLINTFVDSFDKVEINPRTHSNIIPYPSVNTGVINVRNDALKKIYDSNGTLIMDFTNITLEIIREGHTYKFTTAKGSYNTAGEFMKYIVDAYGLRQTLELFMDKFIDMPDTDFQALLDGIIKRTRLMKRMMHNDIYRDAITPVFLESFFTINKDDLKPLLSRMVNSFNKYSDKGYFVNNFIPLKTYYEYSAYKDTIKSLVCKTADKQ